MSTQKLQSPLPLKEAKAFLSFLDGPNQSAVELKEVLTLGRDQGNRLVISDPHVSSRHARIEWCDGVYILRDLRSRNGTFLNGSRVLVAPLSNRDRVKVGNAELVFLFERDHRPEKILLTSKNPDWNQKLKALPDVAQSSLPILINGASGTGKEIIAEQLHRHSPRREGPFVSINCSALSINLAESELFGHTKGSFTDATHDRKGAFESARGGTLFLDEIGDLPLELQPKLLRALENREIRPVGGDRTIKTDVRVIAATHHKLKEQVSLGRFRPDLYFRLNILNLQTPSLRERMEDFEDLLYFFARDMKVSFTLGAIDLLKQHTWPGNIRELKSAVARAQALCGGKVSEDKVPLIIDSAPLQSPATPIDQESDYGIPSRTGNVLKDLERASIEKRLVANMGNQRRTALDLGLPKSTLHDRIKAYDIDIQQLLAASMDY